MSFTTIINIGLACGGRFPWGEVVQYVVAQVLGGIVGAAILYVVATGRADTGIGSFATNGFGEHSPGGYGLVAAAVTEVVMTFGFVTVILGVTDKRAAAFAAAAPLAIGLTLTLIHLISIPVTNTSVNPARSTGVAVFAGGWALQQLWLFWVAPILGGVIGGSLYRWLSAEPSGSIVGTAPAE